MKGSAGRFRLRRSSRLRDRKDFLRVQRSGERRTSRHFVLLRAPQREATDGGPRLGVTVSRRVAHSVGRNRVKRRVREVFRLRRGQLDPADLVVIARQGAAELPESAAREELETLLVKDPHS